MKKVISIIALIVVIVALLGVNGLLVYNAINSKNQEVKNPILSLEVEGYGNVKIELYPEYAPNTVKNIIALANNGYYNGKIFYGMDDIAVYVGRDANGESDNPTIGDIDKSVITEEVKEEKVEETNTTEENTVAETTEATVEITNENDYKYEIDGEFVANSFKQNTLKHEKGVVSLVRADYTQQMQTLTKESYNSGSSQFTIVMEDNNGLNGMYAGFGKVIEGMDIVEKIYGLEIKQEEPSEDGTTENTAETIKPFATAPVITSATVETYGVTYSLPEVHEAFDYSAYLQELLNQYYTTSN